MARTGSKGQGEREREKVRKESSQPKGPGAGTTVQDTVKPWRREVGGGGALGDSHTCRKVWKPRIVLPKQMNFHIKQLPNGSE